jgi:hypothetical protein
LQTTAKSIEYDIKEYAQQFLKKEYGTKAARKLSDFEIKAVDAYDDGGISEITEEHIQIAAKRDIKAGKLTNTTKLIVRHELGHLLDQKSDTFPDFNQEIEREKTAWNIAKPRTAAENWYKNLSIRTHIDPLKMQSMGFPRPEKKVSQKTLKQAVTAELKRMKKESPFADAVLAERFAMANLMTNPHYYS